MKTRKSKKYACDRLSELPDSLIFNIFRLLPITDVVRTTILSKRWRNLWTTTPWLDFNDGNKMGTYRFRNFVNCAMDSWRGIKIVRFSVEFGDMLLESFRSDTDSWIHFAMERRVEELKICLPFRIKAYLVPQHLYSCPWLKALWLKSCDLQIRGNVQWDQLKSLTLQGGGLSEDAINQVLRGSPRLECFHLALYDTKENLSIRSTSLKSLNIGNFSTAASLLTYMELRMSTPNLREFDISGAYRRCLVTDVSPLTKVSLEIDRLGCVGDILTQILPTIKHAETVTLSSCCIKALGTMKEKHLLSPFPNAKFLKLKVCSGQYEQIVGVFELFPNLRNLVLETTSVSSLPKHAESSLKFDTNLPDSFLLQLRRIDVTNWTNGGDSIFPLIKILLKYARNIEKMVLSREKRNERRTSWKSLYMASQELLRMQRSYPAVELILD